MIRLLLDGAYYSGGISADRMIERLDDILTNKYLAIPIFLLVMLFMFSCHFWSPRYGDESSGGTRGAGGIRLAGGTVEPGPARPGGRGRWWWTASGRALAVC